MSETPEIEANAGAFIETPKPAAAKKAAKKKPDPPKKTPEEELSDKISRPQGVSEVQRAIAGKMIEHLGNSPAFANSFASNLGKDEVAVFESAKCRDSLLDCLKKLAERREKQSAKNAKPKVEKG